VEQLTVFTILPCECPASKFAGITQFSAHLSLSRKSPNIYFSIEEALEASESLVHLGNESSVRITPYDPLLPSPYGKSEWSVIVQIGLTMISVS
jgi:hypothetical protein